MRDIKEQAYRHLEHRMRTAYEMRTYLREYGYDDSEIEPLVEELASLNYIDDYEYALRYIEYAISKNRAIYRIKMELRDKGISEENIENAVEDSKEELQIDELANASSVARKELIGVSEIDEKRLGKIVRKLKRLGYGENIIIKIVEVLRKELKSSEEYWD